MISLMASGESILDANDLFIVHERIDRWLVDKIGPGMMNSGY